MIEPEMFECEVWIDGNESWRRTYTAATRGKAKSQYLRDVRDPYPNLEYTWLRSRKIGRARPIMRTMNQSQIDEWNTFFPVGSPCIVTYDDRSEHEHHTTTPAWLLGHGQAVVTVNGIAGGYCLDRVKMLETRKA